MLQVEAVCPPGSRGGHLWGRDAWRRECFFLPPYMPAPGENDLMSTLSCNGKLLILWYIPYLRDIGRARYTPDPSL